MGLRFQRRLKFGPFWLNFSKSGVSASAGIPGLTFNSRGTATTSLPGTGISYRQNLGTRERRQQQRHAPQIPSTESIIQELLGALVGFDKPGDALWNRGLVQRVLDDLDTPRNVREAAVLIRSVDAVELHCRRAKGKAATNRAGLEILRAVQTVLDWTNEQGWSESDD